MFFSEAESQAFVYELLHLWQSIILECVYNGCILYWWMHWLAHNHTPVSNSIWDSSTASTWRGWACARGRSRAWRADMGRLELGSRMWSTSPSTEVGQADLLGCQTKWKCQSKLKCQSNHNISIKTKMSNIMKVSTILISPLSLLPFILLEGTLRNTV